MVVKFSSDLIILFSGSLYKSFKLELHHLVKEIQYMTNEEFFKKYAQDEFFLLTVDKQNIKIHFRKSPNILYLEYVEIEKI